MSNSGDIGGKGNAKPTINVVMAAYDGLPKIVREKVASAALDWDTTAIYRNLTSGRASPREVVELINRYEREYLQRAR